MRFDYPDYSGLDEELNSSSGNINYNFDLFQNKLKIYYLETANLREKYFDVSDITAFSIFEIIFKKIPCEFNGLKYDSSVIDEIFKDNTFKYISFSNGNSSDISRKDIYKKYGGLLVSEKKEMIIKFIISADGTVWVSCCCCNLNEIKKFFDRLNKFEVKKSKCQIGIFIKDGPEINIKRISIDPISLNLDLNYGSNFNKKHEDIVKKLQNKNRGLYILHGPPSGGKTSYIKYLAQVVNRLFVFIPSNVLEGIDSPNLLPVLVRYPNCILILEDAEKAIVSRDQNSNPSLVSTLLNLSDGILGSMLGVSIIVTFNTGKEKIDEALLRKGRLLFEHEFGKLSVEDAKRVAKSLNKDIKIKEPIMLGEIYNYNEVNFHETEETKEKRIGF